jgi:hypothetical protein
LKQVDRVPVVYVSDAVAGDNHLDHPSDALDFGAGV